MFRRFLTIGILSATCIVYQVVITRILSVILWYHWAFLSISVAMLGLSVPAVWFSLKAPSKESMQYFLLSSGILLPLSILLIVHFGTFPGGDADANSHRIILCIIAMLLPMLAIGSTVSALLIDSHGASFPKMYGSDLIGAFLGAAVSIPLMHKLPAPIIIAALGLGPLYCLIFLYQVKNLVRVAAFILITTILLSFSYPSTFALKYSKSYDERNLAPFIEKWTPLARLTVFDKFIFGGPSGFLWGQGKNFHGAETPHYWLEQDGGAGTPITKFNGELRKLDYLTYDVTSVAYELKPPKDVAIIGAGGGRDILTAKHAGSENIDAVEINSATIDLVSAPLRNYSGDVYHLHGVHAMASEGRSFLSHSEKLYDLIQISLTDSWAASTAGAYTLSENSLYTLEAFRLYLSKLKPDGILSTSRWIAGRIASELLTLSLLAQTAISGQDGVTDPLKHIAVLTAGNAGTLLLSKKEFSEYDISRIQSIAKDKGFEFVFPNLDENYSNHPVHRLLTEGPEQFRSEGLTIRVPTDNRPFYFHVISLFTSFDFDFYKEYSINAEAIYVLQTAILLLGSITLVLFFLPFLLFRPSHREKGFWPASLYFAAIGIGFMFFEIAWIQKFILYLGHPSYALTVVLAVLLLGAGLGSMLSFHVESKRAREIGFIVACTQVCMYLALSFVFPETLGWHLSLRIAIAVLSIIIPAFFMGLCLPIGMRLFGEANKAWFWAINGAAGVLASVVSLGIAMEFGYFVILLCASILYLVAWALLRLRAS